MELGQEMIALDPITINTTDQAAAQAGSPSTGTAAGSPGAQGAAPKGIHVTDRALKRVRIAMAKENISPEQGGLRLGVQGGGCSGLSYNIRQ